MKLAFAVVHVVGLGWIFYWLWTREKFPIKKYFAPALLLKLTAGICLGLVYTYYYSVGDTFLYFEDGKKLAHLARTDITSYLGFLWSGDESFSVWSDLIYKQPRAAFLAKITSLLCLLTYDNYWVISLYFSAITFMSAWLLVKRIIAYYPEAQSAAIIGFLFFPSAVFWSAGVIKESLAVAGLFFLSTIFLKVWKKDRVNLVEWLLSILSVWLVWNLKYYYLAIYFPVVVTALAVKFLITQLKISSLVVKAALWFVVFTVPLIAISTLHPNFYPERFINVVVTSYYEFQSISAPEDLIQYTSLEPSASSLIKNTPWAFFSGMFRPSLIEVHNILQFFIALENTIILILFLWAVKNLKGLFQSRDSLLLFSILVYAFLLCVFLALSTPNFGTLSRYRVGFLPFLIFLLTIKNPLINRMMNQMESRALFRR